MGDTLPPLVVGHIVSMSPVAGNLTRLKTRYLYKIIDGRISWYDRINIGRHNEALEKYIFWKNNISILNIKYINHYTVPRSLCFSDASNFACGGFLDDYNTVSFRSWNPSERLKSSTWRELKAIHFCLLSFCSSLKNSSVLWHSDNQAAVRILEVGSPKPDLQSLAIDIFTLCKNNSICLLPYWIPRELNKIADDISKTTDYDDWATSSQFFLYIDKFGAHTPLTDLPILLMPTFLVLILVFLFPAQNA